MFSHNHSSACRIHTWITKVCACMYLFKSELFQTPRSKFRTAWFAFSDVTSELASSKLFASSQVFIYQKRNRDWSSLVVRQQSRSSLALRSETINKKKSCYGYWPISFNCTFVDSKTVCHPLSITKLGQTRFLVFSSFKCHGKINESHRLFVSASAMFIWDMKSPGTLQIGNRFFAWKCLNNRSFQTIFSRLDSPICTVFHNNTT